MNQQLDLKRLGYLGRTYMIDNWRSMAIAAGIVSGAMFLITFLQAWIEGGSSTMDYTPFLIGTMVIWGCISASTAFSALHDKNNNEAYLLLPASSLEKVLINLLVSSLVLPLAIIVLISVTSVISEGVTGLIFGSSFQPLNPFYGLHFKVWGYTVIAQALFFLGSAWFRKAHFIKTVLTLIIGSIALGLLSGVFFRIVFASYFDGFWDMRMVNIDIESLMINRYPGLMNFLSTSGRIVFYGILAPFCWFTAWLRVKETQTSDGV